MHCKHKNDIVIIGNDFQSKTSTTKIDFTICSNKSVTFTIDSRCVCMVIGCVKVNEYGVMCVY